MKCIINVVLIEHFYQNFRTNLNVKRSGQGPIPFEKILMKDVSFLGIVIRELNLRESPARIVTEVSQAE